MKVEKGGVHYKKYDGSYTQPWVRISQGKANKHKKMRIQFKCFLVGDWENMQEKFFLWAQALTTNLSLVLPPKHDPSTHKGFFCSLIFRHVREYF